MEIVYIVQVQLCNAKLCHNVHRGLPDAVHDLFPVAPDILTLLRDMLRLVDDIEDIAQKRTRNTDIHRPRDIPKRDAQHDDNNRLIHADALEHTRVLLNMLKLRIQRNVSPPHIRVDRHQILDDLLIQCKLYICISIRYIDGPVKSKSSQHTVDHRRHQRGRYMEKYGRVGGIVRKLHFSHSQYIRLIQCVSKFVIALLLDPDHLNLAHQTEQTVDLRCCDPGVIIIDAAEHFQLVFCILFRTIEVVFSVFLLWLLLRLRRLRFRFGILH